MDKRNWRQIEREKNKNDRWLRKALVAINNKFLIDCTAEHVQDKKDRVQLLKR